MSIVEFYSTTQRRDHRYNARWVRTKGKELGDKSYGYCEGGLEKSVGEDCRCQGTRRVRRRYPNLVVILALFPKGRRWPLGFGTSSREIMQIGATGF